MPRIHNKNGGREVPYTDAEEAAQDAIDAAWETPDTGGKAVRNAEYERLNVLADKLSDDSITFTELKELMRLRGN